MTTDCQVAPIGQEVSAGKLTILLLLVQIRKRPISEPGLPLTIIAGKNMRRPNLNSLLVMLELKVIIRLHLLRPELLVIQQVLVHRFQGNLFQTITCTL